MGVEYIYLNLSLCFLIEFQEGTGKHTNSSLSEPMPGKETIDAVSESSSASEQQWSGNFEEGSPIIKNYDCKYIKCFSGTQYISPNIY